MGRGGLFVYYMSSCRNCVRMVDVLESWRSYMHTKVSESPYAKFFSIPFVVFGLAVGRE